MNKFNPNKCLWLTLDGEGQLRLSCQVGDEPGFVIERQQVFGVERLPRQGEYLPVWLKVYPMSYDKAVTRAHTCAATAMATAVSACTPTAMAAHNACADTETASPCEETTKRETTKEGSTKKEEKKKRRLPPFGRTNRHNRNARFGKKRSPGWGKGA